MQERRKYSRLEKNLPIKFQQVSHKDFDILTETKNISASGAYCSINKPIALMTKLKIVLLLPGPKTNAKKIKKIDCEGIVVRREENKENKKYPYQIAVFFSDIDSYDRKVLNSYVKNSLVKDN